VRKRAHTYGLRASHDVQVKLDFFSIHQIPFDKSQYTALTHVEAAAEHLHGLSGALHMNHQRQPALATEVAKYELSQFGVQNPFPF
jgi:hypothetical protein